MAIPELYRQLIHDGFNAWLDEENLIPGQRWDAEIQAAVRASDVVVVCLFRLRKRAEALGVPAPAAE